VSSQDPWTGPSALVEADADGRLIDRLVAVALAQPDVVALADGLDTLRYGELLLAADGVRAAASRSSP
jgi:hypothetical protein